MHDIDRKNLDKACDENSVKQKKRKSKKHQKKGRGKKGRAGGKTRNRKLSKVTEECRDAAIQAILCGKENTVRIIPHIGPPPHKEIKSLAMNVPIFPYAFRNPSLTWGRTWASSTAIRATRHLDSAPSKSSFSSCSGAR